MATTNLKRKSIGLIEIQSGNGIPNHSSSIGSEYTDVDTGISYKNSNGGSNWDQQNVGGVQNVFAGTNTYTGGTAGSPTINVSALTINTITVSGASVFSSISATTISGGTLFSGSTNLYSIFSPIGGGSTTYVQPGSNITTGGTAGSPVVSVVDSPSFNNISFSGTATGVALSATTISGGTLYSGSTNLYDIFALSGATGGASTFIQNGLNTYTGGTTQYPTVNISAATLTYLSATTISATTIFATNETWTIELVDALTAIFYAPYSMQINSITNILNSPSIALYDDGALYTLTNTIAIGSKILVSANTASVVSLNATK